MYRVLVSIVLFGIITTGCNNSEGAEETAPVSEGLAVEGYKIKPIDFQREITTTARLMASEQVSLMAPRSGQVLEIFFEEGERVEQGESIIRLDDRSWKAELAGLQSELEAAGKNLQRTKELLSIEGSSEEEVDRARSVVENINAQMEQLRINIQLANVKAPFSGILGMRNFSKGAYLREGDIITTLTAVDELKIDFDVAQEFRSSLESGKEMKVLVDGDTVAATIYAINPVINPESRTINVRARMQQKEGKMILPGTYAQVILPAKTTEDALLIPTQAVVPRIDDQTAYLYRNGKAVRKTIKLGYRTADMVEVVEGLSAGDTVITTGLLQVKEGMPLKLQTLEQ